MMSGPMHHQTIKVCPHCGKNAPMVEKQSICCFCWEVEVRIKPYLQASEGNRDRIRKLLAEFDQ